MLIGFRPPKEGGGGHLQIQSTPPRDEAAATVDFEAAVVPWADGWHGYDDNVWRQNAPGRRGGRGLNIQSRSAPGEAFMDVGHGGGDHTGHSGQKVGKQGVQYTRKSSHDTQIYDYAGAGG